ncbi:zinc-binding dehydrogenase (plasmid) [Methanosphaera sp. ISO3-F5]|uniref:zinc-binding dehydrogenase n=1 Tax=Methanosphaera sp. ISO3-F5 TaxID=1452353 RepID=UPI002B2627F3|nr:zinc-binding dehydrogenase [Methanosphaera sp. ISO3-F5]WQH65462.1 zinc-binding dehydrogenase [Methanosphaera sp. ISO3-F5]
MKAVLLEKCCNADELKVVNIKKPTLKEGYLLVQINAFGINRSEIILRQYEAEEDYIKLPVVPGIECVGTVVKSSDTNFNVGDKVISLMGGMGRSFNGSYQEYALLPIKNTFKISDNVMNKLSTEEIASMPETYFTAYASLFECLQLSSHDTLLIRGATSATGIAALKLARAYGCKIIATTRNNERINKLSSLGADYVVIDDGNISEKVKEIYLEGVDKILELVGPQTLNDSFKALKKHGICCVTGILGNKELIENFDPIKDVPNAKYLTSFFSNYPNQEIIDNIFEYIINNNIKPQISRVYNSLEDISKAHELMESNNAQGKIIIKLKDF